MAARRADARWIFLGVFSVVLLCMGAAGCAKKAQTLPEPVDVVTEPVAPAPVWDEGVAERDVADADALTARLRRVHFEFDRYNLTPEARAVLKDNYGVLQGAPQAQVLVEGHCDNRGTQEYNLALGQRRADSVRDYLTSLGMSAGNIRTISYGKEQPLDPRNNEEAWALNRRAEFKVLGR